MKFVELHRWWKVVVHIYTYIHTCRYISRRTWVCIVDLLTRLRKRLKRKVKPKAKRTTERLYSALDFYSAEDDWDEKGWISSRQIQIFQIVYKQSPLVLLTRVVLGWVTRNRWGHDEGRLDENSAKCRKRKIFTSQNVKVFLSHKNVGFWKSFE